MRNTPNQGKRCHDSAFSEVLAFITKSKRRTFSGGAKAQRLCVPLQDHYRLASAQPSHPEPFSSTNDKTLRENCPAEEISALCSTIPERCREPVIRVVQQASRLFLELRHNRNQ